ncbi:winged helix-turn-helix transcriptional regulator [Actinoplanes derwentensis]|uniref:DNA-binding transcriptional regulator, HxlR family n=1 Tax=Actinoplanes derwentensis TaxID=113562 RepID=A0A1H2BH55_9ACTN|nr:helix-turn-helix domain-containing protein [Actinoplanes derwentensis]GID87820.1 HxlR family transcriptional regulator [Actinoplanes derwentensis]SDT57640.1 DNA-binding transcriptional regulator, HxlR family [Actinoplanes derwentensis]
MSSPSAPPAALNWSVDNCTIERAMGVLGEKWTLVVLREVFAGIRRFDDMRVRTGIPRQVLANRLTTLVGNGVLRRDPYREPGARLRHEYRLTAKGFDLYPIMIALSEWGDRYLADPEGPPISYAHRDCGAELHLDVTCADGHQVTEKRAIQPRPGPGAHPRTETSSP